APTGERALDLQEPGHQAAAGDLDAGQVEADERLRAAHAAQRLAERHRGLRQVAARMEVEAPEREEGERPAREQRRLGVWGLGLVQFAAQLVDAPDALEDVA